MKKLLQLFVLMLLPILASADPVEINGIWYNLVPKAKEAEVTRNPNDSKYSGNIEIPASVTYNEVKYSVTSIGDAAFYGCRGLTSVTIPNSVTSIGNDAFYECSGLTSITIPNSVTSIGENVFYYCSGLTSVIIPNSVTCIGKWAFYACSGLTSVTIGSGVTSIGASAFEFCIGLTTVIIPNSMTSIGLRTFYGCRGLTSVTISNSVTSIGDRAFSNCIGLTSITIPNSVTSIGYEAFSGCSGLTSFTIPNNVMSIGDGAFSGCNGLTSVTIPNSVTSIGNKAFSDCSSLISITIGSAVNSIGEQAFANCDELTDVYSLVEKLRGDNWGGEGLYTHPDAFKDSYPQAMTLHVPTASINAYSSTAPWSGFKSVVAIGDDSTISGKCGDNVYYSYDKTTHTLTISGQGGIASSPWYSYGNDIQSVIIESGVTSIGEEVFRGCSGLTSITIPNSVTSIGSEVFINCVSLTSITIPNSVTIISNHAFERCGLTSITIPDNVKKIGYGTFWDCTSLTSITIPNSVTTLADEAFHGCSGLTSVTIPNSVTSIGSSAFRNCSGLTSINVESGNQYYDSRNNCNAIIDSNNQLIVGCKNTIIPNSVTSIGNNAFDGCSGLTSITIPNSVTSIGNAAFYGCSGLTYTIISDGVTSIGSSAFYGCSGLSQINLPNSLRSIGDHAFANCSLGFVFSEIENPFYIDNTVFEGIPSYSRLIVPYGTKLPYQAATGWSQFSNVEEVKGDGKVFVFGGIFYKIINENNVSISYQEKSVFTLRGDIVIPSQVTYRGKTYNVTDIGYRAFYDFNCLTSVVIPNSITSIGKQAFALCHGLTTVVSEIENPFAVNNDVFGGIPSNAKLIVPKGKKSAYQSTAGWNQITNIVEAGDDSTISGKCGENVYYSYDKTTHTLTIYGEGGMDSYEKKSTPWWSYKDDIQSVIIGSGVTSIGPHAFEFHRCLTSITIPNSVTGIGLYAFEGSSNGKLINIISEILEPFGVQFAFHENAIVLLTVPKDTKALYKATRGWNALNMHIVEAGVGIMEDDNGICYTLDGESAVVLMGVSTKGDVKIKESVETDGKTYQVTDIDDHAFYNTGEITSVVIPKSVETIGSSAFEDCTGLTSLILNEGLLSVGGSAFEGCTGLKSLTIPSTVNTIKMNAFKNCKAITDVYCYAQTVPNTDDAAFDGTPIESATLHVPIGCLDAYKAVAPWKNFKSILEIEDAKVKLSKTKATIEKGKTLTLKATVTPSDLPDKSVTWKSSNKNVATVTSAGKVKGIKAGTATITCTSKATGAKATCKVTVGYVKLNKTEAVINKGKTLTLKAAVYPSTLKDRSVIWKSSNKNVATVTSKGKVKGVKAGTATITCTSNATGLKATCKVTVGYVKLDQSEVTVKKGKTVTLKAAVYPSTLEDKSVTWESSNKKVATVTSKGKVKGIKAGLAVITCTSNATGLITTCIVKVKATAGTRSMEGDENDEVTEIDEVETSATIKPFDVYDLSGRKVLHQVTSLDGLPDGIYIVNGKKVLKKK